MDQKLWLRMWEWKKKVNRQVDPWRRCPAVAIMSTCPSVCAHHVLFGPVHLQFPRYMSQHNKAIDLTSNLFDSPMHNKVLHFARPGTKSGHYFCIFWHHIVGNWFSIFEVMPWIKSTSCIKSYSKPLCAIFISELQAHTHACHDQQTACIFKTWFIWFDWKGKAFRGTVNLEMTMICPWFVFDWMRQLEIFFPYSYSYSSEQDKNEDIRQKWRRVLLKHRLI